VEPEVFLCTYCLADDNPTERQPSEYELKRLRRIENEDDVDDDIFRVHQQKKIVFMIIGPLKNATLSERPIFPKKLENC
jgi:hypothetical protein